MKPRTTKYLPFFFAVWTSMGQVYGIDLFKTGFYKYTDSSAGDARGIQERLTSEASITVDLNDLRAADGWKFTIARAADGKPVQLTLAELTQLLERIKDKRALMIHVSIAVTIDDKEMERIAAAMFKAGWLHVVFYSTHNSGIDITEYSVPDR